MNLKFNNKIPASERRGIIALAFVIVIISVIVATCESRFFYNPVTVTETSVDTIKTELQTKIKSRRTKRQKTKRMKQSKTVRPRSPLDEPISEN